jgi:urease accessory protein UreF
VLAHARKASTVSALLEFDERLTARKLTPAPRSASHTCGRQLAALASERVDDRLMRSSRSTCATSYRETDRNFAVAEAGWRARAIPIRDAVRVELRSAAAGLL